MPALATKSPGGLTALTASRERALGFCIRCRATPDALAQRRKQKQAKPSLSDSILSALSSSSSTAATYLSAGGSTSSSTPKPIGATSQHAGAISADSIVAVCEEEKHAIEPGGSQVRLHPADQNFGYTGPSDHTGHDVGVPASAKDGGAADARAADGDPAEDEHRKRCLHGPVCEFCVAEMQRLTLPPCPGCMALVSRWERFGEGRNFGVGKTCRSNMTGPQSMRKTSTCECDEDRGCGRKTQSNSAVEHQLLYFPRCSSTGVVHTQDDSVEIIVARPHLDKLQVDVSDKCVRIHDHSTSGEEEQSRSRTRTEGATSSNDRPDRAMEATSSGGDKDASKKTSVFSWPFVVGRRCLARRSGRCPKRGAVPGSSSAPGSSDKYAVTDLPV